jgi:regulator of protease activity HflC (stomatin/prohibitin superfamily)
MTERPLTKVPGFAAVAAVIVLAGLAVLLFATSLPTDTDDGAPAGVVVAVLLVLAAIVVARGLVVIPPNQAKAALFLGRYIGTIRQAGFFWINPFTTRRSVSLRIRNFDSDVLKVNDALGNPVEIAAVVAWQIQDTAQALFEVDDFEEFVRIQAETAVRHVASEYPYDDFDEGQASLRANADEVIATLQQELQQRLQVAGVAVLDTRLRRLAYAPEIAGEMLRRQQATAVVAARRRIVEGAVGMVEMALDSLSERAIVDLDEERKAAMVSNLLVVLVSDRGAQPVVNSGSLYT